jgi:hypothetical protein
MVSALARRRPWRRRLGIRLAHLMRWVHIYLSMFGLASILFFSVTGLTLNHPTWFGSKARRTTEAEGRVDPKWLRLESPGPGSGSDPSSRVDKLQVVEHLRNTHGVRGALAEFRVDESECTVTFRGPGYSADSFVDRETGRYTLTQTSQGFVAVINDLHKGRDTGPAWSALIDVSAVAMAAISLTGLVLLLYLKLRRGPGLVVALLGAVAVAAVFLLGVP